MLALLSPAKSLNETTPPPIADHSPPRLGDEAATLAHAAAHLPQKRLRELMGISPALAKLNSDRFKNFDSAPKRPAIYTFAGDVYRGLEAFTLEEPAIAYAQDHLRILSGLYGLLRPLDLIRPYRLEMGVGWAPRRHKLTDWWGDRIAALLRADLEAEGSGVVINLASQEYWAAVDGRLDGARVIAVDFRDGGRFVSFHAKKARGMVARFLVEHRVAEPDGLKAFDFAGYRFDAETSSADRWTFAR